MIKENISVILPAHNEEEVIGRMVEGLLSKYRDKILEIIVVDDSSTDNTSAIVESVAKSDNKVRLVNNSTPSGVGHAIRMGFKSVNSKAEYVLTMDSDFLESIEDVGRMIERMENGECDGVIGSRFIEGSRLEGYPLSKKMMNRAFHLIVRLLFRIKQKDLTNNFKLYKTEIVRELPWRSGGFPINAETGILPILAGYRISEVPVSWIGRNEQMGRSKFRLFEVGMGYVGIILYARHFLMMRNNAGK